MSLPLMKYGKIPSLRRLPSYGIGLRALASKPSDANIFTAMIDNSNCDTDDHQHVHLHAAEATKEAKSNFQESLSTTQLSQIYCHGKDCVAPFEWKECTLGPKLGEGEFSNVYEIKSFDLKDSRHLSFKLSTEELDQRFHMAKSERYRETKEARYAVKIIKLSHLNSNEGKMKYIKATSDLALEAEFLSSLTHPHIMKLRGVAHSGPTGFALVMDRLVETLDERMRRWRSEAKKNISRRVKMPFLSRSISKLPVSLPEDEKWGGLEANVMDERLNIALQIAAAMMYLHSNFIIFRDLKPTNIGFDVRGDAKVFDFGLARFCPKNKGNAYINVFKMSGAGSPRYMAPECLSCRPYNLKADVYTFAIVLWQILSVQLPYAFVRRKHQLIDYVVQEHGRPNIDSCWPTPIKIMMGCSFSADIHERPDMVNVYNAIRDALLSLRDGDSEELSDVWVSRRRSATSV